MKVSFGNCVYDQDTRLLSREGQPVAISPKAFDLLGLLLAARPKAVSKTDLQERLWPDTFVLEANLPNLVTELRSAIGENARRPAFIRTVHGFGYAFSGPVTGDLAGGAGASVDAEAPVFYVAWGREHVLLGQGEHRLGRSPDSNVWLRSSSVSRHHARIRVTGNQAFLDDLGSKNGTFLEGQPVKLTAPLNDGNEIRCGSVVLRFHCLPLLATTDSGSLSSS